METIIFDGEDGTEIELGILEQTRVNGSMYLLVVDPEESDERFSFPSLLPVQHVPAFFFPWFL